MVVHRAGIPYGHLGVKFANRAAHCGEHRREGITGAHREGSERDQLVPWQIDRGCGFLQAAEADVAGDADHRPPVPAVATEESQALADRKSTRLNSSHLVISYAVFCLKKKKNKYASR